MSLADELREEVAEVLFDINSQITQLKGVVDSAKLSGEVLRGLNSHNHNVIVPGAKLSTTMPDEMNRMLAEYAVVVQSLEDYIHQRGE